MRKKILNGMGKRGQLKMIESIAVLIVFFFLVGIGINFYGKVQLKALTEAKEEFARSDAIKVSQKIVHLPEIRCSLETTDQGSCIDLYQANAWASLLQSTAAGGAVIDGCSSELAGEAAVSQICAARMTHYFEQMGASEVVLRKVYSATPGGRTSWVLYNYTTDGAPTFTQIPVIIYDSVDGTRDLGMLEVKAYG